MRIVDSEWDELLKRARTGDCTKRDIDELNKLVLTNVQCEIPDFTKQPWMDAVLVTPRNGLRILWNEKKLKQHCRRTGHTRFTLYACDSTKDEPLTIQQRLVIAGLKPADTNSLPNKVEIAVGIPVMVLTNIDMDCDLANGSRGVIVDILLDLREMTQAMVSENVRLTHPPAAILFKPFFGRKRSLPGLPPGIIPIFPCCHSFSLKGHTGNIAVN